MNAPALALLATIPPAEAWFDPTLFGSLFGGIGGATLGLLGGVFGGLGSWAAQQGKGRAWVLGGMAATGALCALVLLAGLAALILGQPYGIYYPMLLLGGLGAGLFFGLRPAMRKRYAEAEARRIEAETLRRS